MKLNHLGYRCANLNQGVVARRVGQSEIDDPALCRLVSACPRVVPQQNQGTVTVSLIR